TSTLTDGNYVVKAAAFDQAGNKSALSVSFNVTIDGTAPAGPIVAPATGLTVSGTTDVTVNPTDAVGVWKVDFKIDGVVQSTATAAPWTYAWNTGSVANGTHTVSTVTTDLAGNTATSSASVSVQNGVGATVPA